MVRFCATCHKIHPIDKKKCPICGLSDLPRFCTNCKKFVPDGVGTCPGCGDLDTTIISTNKKTKTKKKSKKSIIPVLTALVIIGVIATGAIYFLKSGITIENKSIGLKVGESFSLEVTTEQLPVTYKSVDTDVATVDRKGTITAINVGTTTIIATNQKGRNAKCSVTVSHVEPTAVEFDQVEYTLAPGQNIPLEPVFTPENTSDRTLIYSIDQENIATVGVDGTVTGISEGTAVITAKSSNGVNAVCNIIVLPFANSISMESNVKLTQQGISTLTVTSTPENSAPEEIIWTSSDENIARVEDGKITGVGIGTATIVAETAQTHLTASCIVTVDYAELAIASFNSGGYSSTTMAATNGGSYFSKVIGFKPTASATGGSGGYQYKFDIIKNGSVLKSSGWQSSSSSNFSFSSGGTYTVRVTVRDSRGKTATASETATIS